jgi:hypothetical protein
MGHSARAVRSSGPGRWHVDVALGIFVSNGSIIGGGVALSGGTLTVVTLLLTGRPPALRRK